MKRKVNPHNPESGVALITAITLLMLFTMLGAIWFHEMTTDNAQTDLAVSKTRAQLYANGGVYVRLAEISETVRNGAADTVALNAQDYKFPVYAEGVAGNRLELKAGYVAETTVTVSDENARININHAPPKVLRRLLGVEGRTARAIRASLPVAGAEGNAKQRWLTSVDELVTRDLMTSKELDAVNADLVTVYTVADASNPRRFINVNTAPLPVLQAVLDLQREQAQRVIAARPFFTADELVAAAGKEASLFNTRPPEGGNNGLPPELTFESTCFRIVAETRILRSISRDTEPVTQGRARTEAVFQFDGDGRPHVQFWSEAPGR